MLFCCNIVFLQFTLFCCGLRCSVVKYVLSWFAHFCVEKNWTKNYIEKMTNMRYDQTFKYWTSVIDGVNVCLMGAICSNLAALVATMCHNCWLPQWLCHNRPLTQSLLSQPDHHHHGASGDGHMTMMVLPWSYNWCHFEEKRERIEAGITLKVRSQKTSSQASKLRPTYLITYWRG